jgi:hypothetical protein
MMVIKYTKLLTVWSLIPTYNVFLLYNATTLTSDLKNNRVFPLMMVIMYTKLYDPRAYGSVSILHTRFSTK